MQYIDKLSLKRDIKKPYIFLCNPRLFIAPIILCYEKRLTVNTQWIFTLGNKKGGHKPPFSTRSTKSNLQRFTILKESWRLYSDFVPDHTRT
jgi:hypothetical protein